MKTATDGFLLFIYWWCAATFFVSVASIRPLSHDPLPMSWPPEATGGDGGGEEGAGFRWHARAELLTALLATASPPLALLQPASSSCHGSQVSLPLTHSHKHTIDSHPLRAPPKLQHYPPSVALLCLTFPAFLCRFLHISPPVGPFPEQDVRNPRSRRRTDRSVLSLFYVLSFLRNV